MNVTKTTKLKENGKKDILNGVVWIAVFLYLPSTYIFLVFFCLKQNTPLAHDKYIAKATNFNKRQFIVN